MYLLMSLGVTACATLTPHMNAQLPLGVDTSAVSVLPTSTAGDLNSPTATRADDGWVVAANLLPGGLDARFARRAFYLVHSVKGPLPMPDGDFFFIKPVVQFSVVRFGRLMTRRTPGVLLRNDFENAAGI